MAVGSFFASLAIRLGDGNGNFTTPYPDINEGANSIAIGDFNEDGHQDLYTTWSLINTSSLFFGDGTGSFSEINAGSIGNSPTAIAVADFNEDGHQDLAVASEGANYVSIRLGEGNGNFGGTTNFNVGSEPNSIKTGDFNGDGHQDFAASVREPRGFSYLLGDGTGSFVFKETGANTLFGITGTQDIAIGNFNNDNFEDVAVIYNNGLLTIRSGGLLSESIQMTGNGINISNNGSSPNLIDHTDFGATDEYPNLLRIFTLTNTGATSLSLSDENITFSGADADMFAANYSSVDVELNPGETGQVSVIFEPTSPGIKQATINISFGECNVSGYSFDIQGTGIGTGPDPAVLGDYPDLTIIAGENITVTPFGMPENVHNLKASTNSDFSGVFRADPQTGEVFIMNAKRPGTYIVEVKGYQEEEKWRYRAPGTYKIKPPIDNGGPELYTFIEEVVSTSFILTITDPECSDGLFTMTPIDVITLDEEPHSVAIGDFNKDGIQDLIATYSTDDYIDPDNLPDVELDNFPFLEIVEGTLPDINKASIRWGLGGGEFADEEMSNTFSHELIVGFDPRDIVVGDFDGNGWHDVAVANSDPIGNVMLRHGSEGFLFFPPSFVTFNVGFPPTPRVKPEPRQLFPSGLYSRSLALGDFNNDGHQDLVVGSLGMPVIGGSTIVVRLGDGISGSEGGGFQSKKTMLVGSGWLNNINPFTGSESHMDIDDIANYSNAAVHVAVGDFNGDGNQDIAMASSIEDRIYLRIGDGLGDFIEGQDITVGEHPTTIGIGDFNNDGIQDMAVPYRVSPLTTTFDYPGKVAIILGNNNEAFVLDPTLEVTVGTRPSDIEIADFNGDGNDDFAVTNEGSNTVIIRFGNGDGTFPQSIEIPVGAEPRSVIAGDFDQDHIHDLAVANYGDSTVMIFKGTMLANRAITLSGNGLVIADDDTSPEITDHTDFDFVPSNSSLVRTFTIENTGDVDYRLKSSDIFIDGADADDFSIGGITFPAVIPVGLSTTFTATLESQVEGLKVATIHITNDLCGEITDYDFAIQGRVVAPPELGIYPETVLFTGENITVTPNGLPINIVSAIAYTDAGFTGTLTADPITGEVHITNAGSPGIYTITVEGLCCGELSIATTFVLVVLNPNGCNQTYTPTQDVSTGNQSIAIVIGDFNEDGHQDIISADKGGNTVSIRFGDGTGAFSGSFSIAVGSEPSALAVSDFNEDGHQDIAVVNTADNSVSVRLGDGAGSLSGTTEVTVGNTPSAIAIVDFNLDGHFDLAVINSIIGSVSIRFGDGTGSFTGDTNWNLGLNPQAIDVNDFNLDGFPDLAISNNASSTVNVLLGNGSEELLGTVELSITSPRALVAVFFNSDLIPDLAVVNEVNGTVYILGGLGNGTFGPISTVAVAAGANAISTGDYNGDGKLDIATSSSTANTISIRIGDGLGFFSGNTELVLNNAASVVTGDFNEDGFQDLAAGKTGGASFAFALGAGSEIILSGNGVAIFDGDTSPQLADDTDFGGTASGLSIEQIYTITSNGDASLTIPAGGITFSGSDAGSFSVNGISLPATLPPGASTTFVVSFMPMTLGVKTATIHIANDDCNASDFDFAIRGIGSNVGLGSYPDATVLTGGNTTVSPSVAPINATSIIAFTDPKFQGIFSVDPISGELMVTNAMPVGSYEVTIRATDDLGGTVMQTLTLEVNDPYCSSGYFHEGESVGGQGNYFTGDFNNDGIHDLLSSPYQAGGLYLAFGNGDGTFMEKTLVVSNSVYRVLVADFDGDGNEDFAANGQFDDDIYVAYGDGTGSFPNAELHSFGNAGIFNDNINPINIALADFNKDGFLDIVGTSSAYWVSILYGRGPDGFSGHHHHRVDSGFPEEIDVGDFNNDGIPDIAFIGRYYSGSTFAPTLFIRFGNTEGTLSFGANINVEDLEQYNSDVIIDDFNNDNHDDIAVSTRMFNPQSNSLFEDYNVSIFISDGMGAFTRLDNPVFLEKFIVGDFNGNGNQDFVGRPSVFSDSYVLTSYAGDGTGNFSPLEHDLPQFNPDIIGDFNLDGNLDWIAKSGNLFLGREIVDITGTSFQFSEDHVYIADGDHQASTDDFTDFGTACIDDDPLVRFFTITNTSSETVTLQNGDLSLDGPDAALFSLNPLAYPISIAPGAGATFSVNLVLTSPGLKTAVVHFNNSSSSCPVLDYDFTIQGTILNPLGMAPSLGNYPDKSIPLGANTDIIPDAVPTNTIFATAQTGPDFTGILTADPLSGLVHVTNAKQAGTYMVTVSAQGLCVSESTTFTLTVASPSCGDSPFAEAEDIIVESVDPAVLSEDIDFSKTAVGDFNGDDIQDFAVLSDRPTNYDNLSAFNNVLFVFLGNGDGTFDFNQEIGIEDFVDHDIAVGDFNGNGIQDLVIVGFNGGFIYFGNGDGTFVRNHIWVDDWQSGDPYAQRVAVGDFNNDMVQDILVGYSEGGIFTLFGDRAGGMVTAPNLVATGSSLPKSMVIGDFNNDGNQDFVTANNCSGADDVPADCSITFFLGDGTGQFTAGTIIDLSSYNTSGQTPYALVVGDFDNNGNQDIAYKIYTGTHPDGTA